MSIDDMVSTAERVTTPFTHRVTSGGPAQGRDFAGLQNSAVGRASRGDIPLVIAVHGGGYHSSFFDLPGHSLLDRGAALGIPVIAVDRPNYGGSDTLQTEGSILEANVDHLDHLIGELWTEHGQGTAGVFLIGHSIGAAIALLMAARDLDWPLLGVSTSGCLFQEPPGTAERWASIPLKWLPADGAMRFQLMFGPKGTYDEDVPAAEAAFHGDTPVLLSELIEVSDGWEERFRVAAAQIAVPVHVRHAQHDHLWVSSPDDVAEFGRAFTSAPVVDVALWPDAGHDIDYHRSGAAFQVQQLAFALASAARAGTLRPSS